MSRDKARQPRPSEPNLELGVARRLYPATLLVMLVIGAGFPGVFFVLERVALATSAAAHAGDLARDLSEAVVYDPRSWPAQARTHLRVVGDILAERGVAEIRIDDAAGREVAGHRAGSPGAWLNRHAPTGAAPLVFQDEVLGHVHVRVSQLGAVRKTAALLLVSATVGFGFLLFIRAYPLRFLRTMERQIHELLDTIRHANLELEQRAAEQAAAATENARLYEGAQRTLTELQAKNAELDSFVYSVSHDLKAPLVSLQGLAGALLEDHGPHLDPGAHHYLARLQANVEQMERLIRGLQTFSRIGRECRAAEPVHLAEVAEDVAAELAEVIRERGIKVTVRDTAALWGIRAQVEQVLWNLVSNAVKYLGDTPSPTLEVGTIDRGPFVECYVRDNGIGIDPIYHDKVFEIFQRLQEVEAAGAGVGLAIVKKIVDGAGGRVWVESTKGEGATFRFTWPAGPDGAAVPRAKEVACPHSA